MKSDHLVPAAAAIAAVSFAASISPDGILAPVSLLCIFIAAVIVRRPVRIRQDDGGMDALLGSLPLGAGFPFRSPSDVKRYLVYLGHLARSLLYSAAPTGRKSASEGEENSSRPNPD